jgi:translation initiation factor 2A
LLRKRCVGARPPTVISAAHAINFTPPQGQPASIKIYGLSSLSGQPTCQKSFFKADRAQIKWNTLGTQVLVLTQTEVDNSGKSYYGETGGFCLLSAAGNFDLRLNLDKDGGIHDFNWSPNSKEFAVIYGCTFPSVGPFLRW